MSTTWLASVDRWGRSGGRTPCHTQASLRAYTPRWTTVDKRPIAVPTLTRDQTVSSTIHSTYVHLLTKNSLPTER
ncbi:MAG: hypothetical protein QOJ19_2169 [Acidimicrobiia bacterium]|nr:hypothetical protein [Acidimicrobiia bacterium]